MSEERYIVWVEEFGFVDKLGRFGEFYLREDDDKDWKIVGELGDHFFSSVEEAREFITNDLYLKLRCDDQMYTGDVEFNICKVGPVVTAQQIAKKGKVVSEYSYFESFEDVNSFSMSMEDDFERKASALLEETSAREISKWILENSDLVMKYIQENTK